MNCYVVIIASKIVAIFDLSFFYKGNPTSASLFAELDQLNNDALKKDSSKVGPEQQV